MPSKRSPGKGQGMPSSAAGKVQHRALGDERRPAQHPGRRLHYFAGTAAMTSTSNSMPGRASWETLSSVCAGIAVLRAHAREENELHRARDRHHLGKAGFRELAVLVVLLLLEAALRERR